MAEAHTCYLEIITPERQFYIGPAEALILPAVDGEMGIYPGHEPVVTVIEPGELRYKAEGQWEPAAGGSGFAEIKPDYVILLVSSAEHPEEIDRKRAVMQLLQETQKQYKDNDPDEKVNELFKGDRRLMKNR